MTGQNWFDAILAFITGSGVTGALSWLRAHATAITSVTQKVETLLGNHQALDSKVNQLETQLLDTTPSTGGTSS